VGAPARAELAFCGDRLCRITVLVDPELGQVPPTKAYLRGREQMYKRYGPPAEDQYNIETVCKDQSTLPECFSGGQARALAAWKFPTGHQFRLQLEAEQASPEAPRRVILRLENAAPEAQPAAAQPAPAQPAPGPPSPAAPQLCIPGQTIACAGPRSCPGYQVCADDGRRYQPCQCE
jgi:hypothetical protein